MPRESGVYNVLFVYFVLFETLCLIPPSSEQNTYAALG